MVELLVQSQGSAVRITPNQRRCPGILWCPKLSYLTRQIKVYLHSNVPLKTYSGISFWNTNDSIVPSWFNMALYSPNTKGTSNPWNGGTILSEQCVNLMVKKETISEIYGWKCTKVIWNGVWEMKDWLKRDGPAMPICKTRIDISG